MIPSIDPGSMSGFYSMTKNSIKQKIFEIINTSSLLSEILRFKRNKFIRQFDKEL